MERCVATAGTESLIERSRSNQALSKLVGEAPVFLEAIEHLPEIACADDTLLIEGETGTGKELVARATHYLSPRASFPFIPVNCGALPETLLEDELFGHKRGAFTDAQARRFGLLAQAEKGTLFLDEVDTLTPRAQVVLLRVLQDKTFRVLGSSCEQRADVRFVAATNTGLRTLVEAQAFRQDLYYRLCVFSISLPALRHRGDDILRLSNHFLRRHASDRTPMPQLSPEACALLLAYNWPGNVRELENAIIRGVHLCRTGIVEVSDLELPSMPGHARPSPPEAPQASSGTSFRTLKKQVIERFERQYLVRLLREHSGNVSRAAQAACKERRDFGKLLKKYQIDAKLFLPSKEKASKVAGRPQPSCFQPVED
jgi:DNA-binding NtrC family response regulator